MQTALQVDAFSSFTLAIFLLFIGKALSQKIDWLRRYSIPEPVAGGVFCAAVVCTLYYSLQITVHFTLDAREMLLLYFFAAIGLNSQVHLLLRGGKALMLLLALASGFMVLQNLMGMALAGMYGLDPLAGLMTGSIPLTGGLGTTLAWAPYFTEELGIKNAEEIGLSANMIGMIAACLISGPIANYLMKRHSIAPSQERQLEIGATYQSEPYMKMSYHGVLLAIFWLNIALMLGRSVSSLISLTGLNLPDFVGCLLAGIILRTAGDAIAPKGRRLWTWSQMRPGIALISDVSLGIFLTMALMGLQLWELQHIAGFITIAMLSQIIMALVFTVFIVFRLMGRNYEAAVISSGFSGIALGSTATAVASMSAVTREYGAAPQAFLIVPLVCGFFIDLVNALVIGMMIR
jgi:ESS family glutamate:Na+ symporter